jgi:hypothetical protein
MRLSPLGTAATTGPFYQPQMIDCGGCEAIGGMKMGRGNRSTRRTSTPAPLCPPQISYDQTRARTRAAAVASRRLTAWVMARPNSKEYYCYANVTYLCIMLRQKLRLFYWIRWGLCGHSIASGDTVTENDDLRRIRKVAVVTCIMEIL